MKGDDTSISDSREIQALTLELQKVENKAISRAIDLELKKLENEQKAQELEFIKVSICFIKVLLKRIFPLEIPARIILWKGTSPHICIFAIL